MRLKKIGVLAALGLAGLTPTVMAQQATTTTELFPLSAVELLDSPFLHAHKLQHEHLMKFNVDRLLAPYRREAGLEPKAQPYPSWESGGLDGHSAGHYLSGMAQMAATGDEEARERLNYMISELAEIQRANGDGYVGGVPGSDEVWGEIAIGNIRPQPFNLNGRWVPWYNLHKIYQGVRDAWLIAGNEQAREILIGMADWCYRLLSPLTDEQIQRMLSAEHGGMNEIFADVYAITGDEKYLEMARRFSHRQILDPLIEGRDDLTGKHANTQIPKVVGFERIYEVSGDEDYGKAARTFWDIVTQQRSVVIGGNSVSEHFNPVNDFSRMIEDRSGPETCNTYNMLRLTERLFRVKPEARLVDFYERALYNHILSSQHPETGGYVYFAPMRPLHYRVYSTAENNFWCCVGTGMENHSKYGAFIYAHDADGLYVNLFIPSELKWADRGITVRQENRFPEEPSTRLTLTVDSPKTFALRIRRPVWVADGFAVTVNGQAQSAAAGEDGFVTIEREWRSGDVVEVQLPMQIRVERLPDGSDYAALLYGPLALAAPAGDDDLVGLHATSRPDRHVAEGPMRPLDEAPMLVADIDELPSLVKPVEGEPLTFTLAAAIRPDEFDDLKLIPFHRVHEQRYMIYWRTLGEQEYAEAQVRLAAEEAERMALETATIDRVVPGEQQPEVDHNVMLGESETGSHAGRSFRHGQRFGYDLRMRGEGPVELFITYWGADQRQFDININGRLLRTVNLAGNQGQRFYTERYPIPAEVLNAADDGLLRVEFVARPGSMAGGIFDVRLVRPQQQ